VQVPQTLTLLRWLASVIEDHPAMHGSLMRHTPWAWEGAIAATAARRLASRPAGKWVQNSSNPQAFADLLACCPSPHEDVGIGPRHLSSEVSRVRGSPCGLPVFVCDDNVTTSGETAGVGSMT
jgi:hypothetical protein